MKKSEVLQQYREKEDEIKQRIKEFKALKEADEERIFQELVFVILTSQTNAKKAWKAAERLEDEGLLIQGSGEDIAEVLAEEGVQYEEEKAGYIIQNRNSLSQPTLTDPEKGLKLGERGELPATISQLCFEVEGASCFDDATCRHITE